MARAVCDLYASLGVSPGAPRRAIERAYRERLEAVDADLDDAVPDGVLTRELEDERQELVAAYLVLRDPSARATYDRLRAGEGFLPGGELVFLDRAYDELALPTPEPARLGQAIAAALTRGARSEPIADCLIPFELAALGGEARIRVPARISCPSCGGTGAEDDILVACEGCTRAMAAAVCERCEGRGYRPAFDCESCGSRGWVPGVSDAALAVPAGVTDGTLLRVPGFGSIEGVGEDQIPRIRVRVAEHPVFRRRGRDVHCNVPVSATRAKRGWKLRVRTLRGLVRTVSIPPDTPDGALVRLHGEGIDADGERGDQILTICVDASPEGQRGGKE